MRNGRKQQSANKYISIITVVVLIATIAGGTLLQKNNQKSFVDIELNGQQVANEKVESVAIKETNILVDMLSFWAKNTLLNPNSVLQTQIPALGVANDPNYANLINNSGKDVFAAIYEDDSGADSDIKIEIQNLKGIKTPTLIQSDNPSVLLYSTHATEAFKQADGDSYKESDPWRTRETDKNIVGVSAMIAKSLQEDYGINVVHDKTNFEPPRLGTSYTRSVKMLEEYKAKYNDLQVYIDVHRDAYNGSSHDVVKIDGKDCARILFVVGTGEGENGKAINPRPDYKANYALAQKITDNANQIAPGFGKEIRLKKNRYNQHISNGGSLLIEVGHNANTLQEVKNAIPYIAKAIAKSIETK